MYLRVFITQVKADSLREAVGSALLTNNRKILESEVRSMLVKGGLDVSLPKTNVVEDDSSSDDESGLSLGKLKAKRQSEANSKSEAGMEPSKLEAATAVNRSKDDASVNTSEDDAALEAAIEASKLTAALEASLLFKSADIWPGTLKNDARIYLQTIKRRHVHRPADGHCFYTSLLDQLGYSKGWCIHLSVYLSPSLYAFSVVTACENQNVDPLVAEMRSRMIKVHLGSRALLARLRLSLLTFN